MGCITKIQALFAVILFSGISTGAFAWQNQGLTDTAVKQDINSQLCQEENTRLEQISTHVSCGVIQAAGFVDNEVQLIKVIKILETYGPNYNILNDVQIALPANHNAKDKYLAKVIMQRLKTSPYSVRDVRVQVRNGHVILSGFVNAQVNTAQLENKIMNLRGVEDIDNLVLHKQQSFA